MSFFQKPPLAAALSVRAELQFTDSHMAALVARAGRSGYDRCEEMLMRRHFQFSLRAGLALIAVVAILLAHEVNRARRQREAVDAIKRLEGSVIFDWERVDPRGKPLKPSFLRRLLGNHLFARVESVDLSRDPVTDDTLVHLEALSGLERLWLTDTPITGRGFVHLRDLSSIRELALSGTNVTDESLVSLAVLRNLEFLTLDDTQITDAGLHNLASMSSLRYLALGDAERFSDAAFDEFEAALPDCRIEAL